MKKKDSFIWADITNSIQDLMQLLTAQQQEELKNCISVQQFKKNEAIYQ